VKSIVINIDDLVLDHHVHGEKFEARYGHVSEAINTKLLGCGVHIVPPGKRAWPYHNHHVNEELYVILDGEGTLRIGERELPIRNGDVIAAPPGGKDTAHQIINTGKRDLKYLCVSTMIPSEVVEYPDSGKTAFYVGSAPGGDPAQRTISYRTRLAPQVEYWDGE
jgi:uncharacterized cupin superfamily protein